MKQKAYYIFVGTVFILFFVIAFFYDKEGTRKSLELSFSGTIEYVVYFKDQKGMDFKINNLWYRLEYNPDFERLNFIGCKIDKKANKHGVWIENKKGSGYFVYYDVSSGLIKDRDYIIRLNRHVNKKK